MCRLERSSEGVSVSQGYAATIRLCVSMNMLLPNLHLSLCNMLIFYIVLKFTSHVYLLYTSHVFFPGFYFRMCVLMCRD
uniref:Uncharacterized protein n=1 Tax=Aegilops tauschii subsp. strangulata TaxID=200361 RepID=A0A453GEU7_AEGTS